MIQFTKFMLFVILVAVIIFEIKPRDEDTFSKSTFNNSYNSTNITGQTTQDEFSAEKINDSTNSSQIPAEACYIGQVPKNGRVENTITPFTKLTIDDYVNTLTSITYKCKDNYFIDGPVFNTCIKGEWINAAPECKPYCSPNDISGDSIVPIICTHNNKKIQCSDPAPPGTIANVNCREMYQRELDKGEQVTTCGIDGVWTPPLQKCLITCGIVAQNITKSPWNVYFSLSNWNGFGTIINDRMVLSTAFGFWNRNQRKTFNLSSAYVNIVRENNVFQSIKIERIGYAPNHRKFLEFPTTGNIAVIVLRTSIVFSTIVVPICLPFELYVNDVTPNSFIGRTPQQDNLEIELPTNCYSEMNSDKPLAAIDEICSKRLKLSIDQIRGGSGFAVPIEKNGSEVFYLLGIHIWYRVYDQGTYFRFQNVLFYENFIQSEISYENDKRQNSTNSPLSDKNVNMTPRQEECSLTCGVVTQNITKTPWNVRVENEITKSFRFGTIVNARLVITLAELSWNQTAQKTYDLSQIYVTIVIGNIIHQQIEVERVAYAPNHKKFLVIPASGNIAVVVLRTSVDFKSYVAPICLPFDIHSDDIILSSVILNNYIDFKSYVAPVCIQFGLKYDDRNVQANLLGKVAGWGLVQTSGEPSPVLKEIELPVINRKDCSTQSTMEFRRFITSDKFCGGYVTGVGVCRGDSGGGLVIPQTKGSKTFYFLSGIVSSGATLQGSCDNDKYSTFTNVAYYSDLIQKYYLEYEPNL